MAVGSDIANHAGVYVGDFKILHHAPHRLSCRDNYNGIWKQHTRDVLRHERFL
jgi:cell wall-associated NlpC family hydrolase